MTTNETQEELYDVVVVGAGAAGVGVTIALEHAGIENICVLERYTIGASFALWPAETRLITPSFATNSVGMLDLNAVAIGTSPAYGLQVEHPTGREYARYLLEVAEYFELPIRKNCDVKEIARVGDEFHIKMDDETVRAKHVVWAAGEYQYPRLNGFVGSELCRHTATIINYEELEGDDFIVVGGYESGVDAASHLSNCGKKVRLFDTGCPWESESADPSIALSPFSLERMRKEPFKQQVELFPNMAITAITRVDDIYEATTSDGLRFRTNVSPLLAGGFEGSHKLVAHLFEKREDGFPLLSEDDESTIVPGMFLCGPSVRHESHVFCFIYKYRQRFAVVAKAIATALNLPAEDLETYREWGMYLDDLSCCGDECVC